MTIIFNGKIYNTKTLINQINHANRYLRMVRNDGDEFLKRVAEEYFKEFGEDDIPSNPYETRN